MGQGTLECRGEAHGDAAPIGVGHVHVAIPSPAGAGLVEDHAQRVEIALGRHVAARLFRRHVGRGAHEVTRLGQRGIARRVGDAEIAEQGPILHQEDVGGLDVAVHRAELVNRLERTQELHTEGCDIGDRQGAPLEPRGERFALDQIHDVVMQAGRLAGLMDGDDVGVAQGGEEPGLAEEPLGGHGGRHLRPQDLDGHPAVEGGIVGDKYDPHSPGCEFALDLVVGSERLAHPFQQKAHGTGWVSGNPTAVGDRSPCGLRPSGRCAAAARWSVSRKHDKW